MSKPILAVTTGDPLGVGPEVLVKTLTHASQSSVQSPVRPSVELDWPMIVLGSVDILRSTASRLGAAVEFRAIDGPASARFEPGVVDVMELGFEGLAELPLGQVNAQAGKASVEYVIRAAEMALLGEVAAVVTGPIHKEAVQAGGFSQYIGNTEIFEDVCSRHTGVDYHGKCMTMLITKSLRVAHVTRHVPFKDIVSKLSTESVESTIRLTIAGMASLGIPDPRVGVAGLNPHNGEHGLMGREELDIIGPAVERLRGEGLTVEGPVPADSIFFKAIGGAYDAVVAMYHDQGHIAIKVHGFEESITISLGIPVIRTSVDHGTAFDIAGQGLATEDSMLAAIALAQNIVRVGRWQDGLKAAEPAHKAS